MTNKNNKLRTMTIVILTRRIDYVDIDEMLSILTPNIVHSSFGKRWLIAFKWEDRADDIKIKYEMYRLGRNSNIQRAVVRKCVGISMPSYIKKPSYESCIAAIRTKIHIVKFKSHPTGKIMNCFNFDEKVNNSVHG